MNTNTPGTSAEPGRRSENAPGTLILHPATGELLDASALEREPPENLADLLAALRDEQAKIKRAEQAVAAELEQRLTMRKRTKWLVGDYEIERSYRNARKW